MSLERKITEYYNLKTLSDISYKDNLEYDITLHVYETNKLEGSSFTHLETNLAINKNYTVGSKTIKELDEQIGTKLALVYLIDNIAKDLTNDMLHHLYSLIKYRLIVPLDYRTTEVAIKGSKVVLTNASDVNLSVDEHLIKFNRVFKDFNLIDNPCDIAKFTNSLAMLHLEFELIHPFNDYNGQIGRLLLNYHCLKQGLPLINITNRTKYLHSFESYYYNNDNSLMVELVEEALIESLDNYINFINN